MKKTWKPAALVMAILLMMSTLLAGCGGGSGDPIVGKWTLSGVDVAGTVVDIKDFAEQYGLGTDASAPDISFDIRADGTLTGNAAGEEAEGTWEVGTGAYTLTIQGESQDVTLEDGNLVMEISGMKMVFSK